MDHLADTHLGWKTIKFNDVVIPELGRNTFADVPLVEACHYAAEDVAITLILGNVLDAKLAAEGLTEVEKLDQSIIPGIFQMKKNGSLVDVKQLRKLEALWTEECAALERTMDKLAGRHVNPGSPKQVARVLYEDRGLAVLKQTDSGADSTDGDTLELLAGDPFVDTLLEWRGKSKLLTTYAKGLQTKVNPSTGRVHGDFNTVRTVTGRLSSSDPNLQNLSARSEDGKKVREAICAAKGNRLVGGDYAAIEYRVLAHVANEPALIAAFNAGKDMHIVTASIVLDKPEEEVTKKERGIMKNFAFANLYGAGPNKLAAMSGLDLQQTYEFLDGFNAAYPRIAAWKEEVLETARERLFVETLFGRRIHVPKITSRQRGFRGHAERLAINGTVQGSAADLMRLAIPAVKRVGDKYDAKMLITCHDELILEAATNHAEQLCKEAAVAMNTCADHLVKWKVPILSEWQHGATWLDLK
jgi:DNA polymerase-1